MVLPPREDAQMRRIRKEPRPSKDPQGTLSLCPDNQPIHQLGPARDRMDSHGAASARRRTDEKDPQETPSVEGSARNPLAVSQISPPLTNNQKLNKIGRGEGFFLYHVSSRSGGFIGQPGFEGGGGGIGKLAQILDFFALVDPAVLPASKYIPDRDEKH